MPLFFHILFWAFFVISAIASVIYVIYSWSEGLVSRNYENYILKRNAPDPTSSNIKPNFAYRNAAALSLLWAVGSTFIGIIVIAGILQVASWIYGWGV